MLISPDIDADLLFSSTGLRVVQLCMDEMTNRHKRRVYRSFSRPSSNALLPIPQSNRGGGGRRFDQALIFHSMKPEARRARNDKVKVMT